MNTNCRRLSLLLTGMLLFLLIVDTDTAVAGAEEGICICLKVIIPSLFPFFMVTSIMNSSLLGQRIPVFRYIGKWIHFPLGGESLLLLGLIGGYPVGAKLIADNYNDGRISKSTSQILLGYCSNAGPAFIFGIAGSLFSSNRIVFFLWGIHILSALVTAYLLPRPAQERIHISASHNLSISIALKSSIHICASVCGWIILFKSATAYLDLWVADILPDKIYIYLSGVLELSNGCLLLKNLPFEAERFILCSTFLSFGGLCVLLQTLSATKPLGLGLYFHGKVMQTSISIILSSVISCMLFQIPAVSSLPAVLIFLPLLILTTRYVKKSCGNFANSAI